MRILVYLEKSDVRGGIEVFAERHVAGLRAEGHEVEVVHEGGAVLREDAGVPKRLDLVERDEDVRSALLYYRRGDGRAEAHLARHRAAALGHAVYLGLLDVHSRDCRGLGEDVGGEDDSLAADADERYVDSLHGYATRSTVISGSIS